MMALWQPISNLRSHLVHHPPVVVFFLCLLLLSGAFISTGLYSENHDIKNPDIILDWNQMLGSLASLKFCTHLNNTEPMNLKQDIHSLPLIDHGDASITNTSQKYKGVCRMFLLVPLVLVGDDPVPNSITATLLGSQLGLKGADGKESLNITLFQQLQTQTSNTDPNTAPLPKTSANAETKPRSYVSCLMINAPAHILPETPSPTACPADDNLEKDMSSVRTFAIESYKQSVHKSRPCFGLEFTPDPKLTVVLTQEEKDLARKHLMMFSVVLLAVCCMMCLSGSLTCFRSRRHLANDIQKETLGL